MGSLKKFYFGKKKTKANTFIGGVSGIIPDVATLSAYIGIPIGRLRAFKIVGSDIEFAVTGGTYEILNRNNNYSQTLNWRSNVTYYHDPNGLVTRVQHSGFRLCTKLTEVNLPFVNYLENYAFGESTLLTTIIVGSVTYYGQFSYYQTKITSLVSNTATVFDASAFRSCDELVTVNITSPSFTIGSLAFTPSTSLASKLKYFYGLGATSIGNTAFQNNPLLETALDFPNCTSVGSNVFFGCVKVPSVNFPNVVTVGGASFRQLVLVTSFNLPNCTSVGTSTFYETQSASIYMPKCTILGATVGNDSVFFQIKTGCTITVPSSLATANAGAPDGDLVYASGTRGATIIYV